MTAALTFRAHSAIQLSSARGPVLNVFRGRSPHGGLPKTTSTGRSRFTASPPAARARCARPEGWKPPATARLGRRGERVDGEDGEPCPEPHTLVAEPRRQAGLSDGGRAGRHFKANDAIPEQLEEGRAFYRGFDVPRPRRALPRRGRESYVPVPAVWLEVADLLVGQAGEVEGAHCGASRGWLLDWKRVICCEHIEDAELEAVFGPILGEERLRRRRATCSPVAVRPGERRCRCVDRVTSHPREKTPPSACSSSSSGAITEWRAVFKNGCSIASSASNAVAGVTSCPPIRHGPAGSRTCRSARAHPRSRRVASRTGLRGSCAEALW